MARWITPASAFFMVLLLGILAVGQTKLLRDPGTYWHTVVGERMIETGEVVRVDPFSFTRPGEPWIAMQWLAECGMAVLHRMGGLDLMLLATAAMLAWLYAWLGYRFLATACHPILAILFVAMTMAASSYHFHVRPHILSIAFMGWTYALLLDVEEGRWPLWTLAWLVPVFVLWTNLHAGLLGGIGTVGLVFAGWTVGWLTRNGGPIPSARGFAVLVVVGGLVLLTPFVNPFGVALPRVWLDLSSSPLLPLVIEEHAPLEWGNPKQIGVVAMVATFVLCLVSVPFRHWRWSWLIPLVWLYLGTTRIRHAPLFAITAALAIAEMLPYSRPVQWLLQSGSTLVVPPEEAARTRWNLARDWPSLVLPSVLLALAITFDILRIPVPLLGAGWAKPDPTNTPLELVEVLRSRMPAADEPPRPLFNDLNFGGFVIFHLPGYRVFIDDRCEFYDDDGLREYLMAREHHPEAIDLWQKQYGFTEALVERGSGFDRYLETAPDWKVLAETPNARVHARRLQEL